MFRQAWTTVGPPVIRAFLLGFPSSAPMNFVHFWKPFESSVSHGGYRYESVWPQFRRYSFPIGRVLMLFQPRYTSSLNEYMEPRCTLQSGVRARPERDFLTLHSRLLSAHFRPIAVWHLFQGMENSKPRLLCDTGFFDGPIDSKYVKS